MTKSGETLKGDKKRVSFGHHTCSFEKTKEQAQGQRNGKTMRGERGDVGGGEKKTSEIGGGEKIQQKLCFWQKHWGQDVGGGGEKYPVGECEKTKSKKQERAYRSRAGGRGRAYRSHGSEKRGGDRARCLARKNKSHGG